MLSIISLMSKALFIALLVGLASCEGSMPSVNERTQEWRTDHWQSDGPNRLRRHGSTCRELVRDSLRPAGPLASELLYTVDGMDDPLGMYRYSDLLMAGAYKTWPTASHDIPVDLAVWISRDAFGNTWRIQLMERFDMAHLFEVIVETGLPDQVQNPPAEWVEDVLSTLLHSVEHIEYTWIAGPRHANRVVVDQEVDASRVRACLKEGYSEWQNVRPTHSWNLAFQNRQ